MATYWHGYIGVEDLALTAPQRAAILAAFSALGPASDPQPARLLQRRVSLDGSKVCYEALFNEDNLTVANVKQFLANAVGVDPAIIADQTTMSAYGPVVTYSVAAVDRIRFLVFGGLTATWDESRRLRGEYRRNNLSEWDEGEE